MAEQAVTGVFEEMHDVVNAVESLQSQGYRDLTVFGPIMETELEDAIERPPSPVRRYTLFGGLAGAITGFGLTIWSSFYYPLVAGGKPLASVPAYVVIGFELTILFAGLAALLGMLIHNRMPRVRLHSAYDTRFSEDRFGIYVECDPHRVAAVEALLRDNGSSEVHVER